MQGFFNWGHSMDKVIELIKAGKSATEIAKETGRSSSGVYLIAQKNSLTFQHRLSDKDKQIIDLRNEGFGYREIARIVKTDAGSVREKCKTLGCQQTEEEKNKNLNNIRQSIKDACSKLIEKVDDKLLDKYLKSDESLYEIVDIDRTDMEGLVIVILCILAGLVYAGVFILSIILFKVKRVCVKKRKEETRK